MLGFCLVAEKIEKMGKRGKFPISHVLLCVGICRMKEIK
jgi:hypothetical protein